MSLLERDHGAAHSLLLEAFSSWTPHFDPAAVGVCQLLPGLLASPEQTDTGGLRFLCAPCLKPGFLVAKSFAILKFRFGRISLKIKAKLSFLSLQIF